MFEVIDSESKKRERLAERLLQVPFYKKKLTADLLAAADWQSLPFTTKDELRQARSHELLGVPRREIAHYHESSGTTGQPSVSWFTRRDIRRGGEQIRSAGIGLQEDDLVLIRFPFALFLPAYLVQEAANQAGAGIVPASSRNTVSTYPKVVRLMMELGVTVLAGIPREMELLAEAARLLGWDPRRDFPSLRGIIVAGELLSPSRKRQLEKLWKVPVFNLYGSTETGNMAAMCEHGVMHLAEDDYLVEVYDDELRKPLPPGEIGQAVLTTWTHEGSPLLRYANGDAISLHPSACPCGSPHRELRHYGRWNERIHIGEQAVYSHDWQDLLYQLDPAPVAWYVEERADSVRVVAEFPARASISTEALEEMFQASLGAPIHVHIASENELLRRTELLESTGSRKPSYIRKVQPDARDASLQQGVERFLRGDYVPAQELFRKAVQERPSDAEAHAWLAAAYGKRLEHGNLPLRMELLPLMKREAHMAAELDPTCAMARQVKGMFYLRTPVEFGGDPERAVDELKAGLLLGAKDSEIWIHLTDAYRKSRRLPLARQALEQARTLHPQHPEVLRLVQLLQKEEE